MNIPFAPSFQHFQKDIERYLKSMGKCEKNEHGRIVFRGYPAALEQMFRAYIEKDAIAPLVAEFRTWNWEREYDDKLMELTSRLQKTGNWPLLKELWGRVIAKRRTHYNQTMKMRRALPGNIPEESVSQTRDLLLDSLYRLRGFATELKQESEIGEYLEMIERVEKRNKA